MIEPLIVFKAPFNLKNLQSLSFQSCCTAGMSGISGNKVHRSSTKSFPGPVSVRHLSFFDSLPIQKLNPVIPSDVTAFSYFLILYSQSILFSFVAFSIQSKRRISSTSKSIRVPATCRNICKLSTTSLVNGIVGKSGLKHWTSSFLSRQWICSFLRHNSHHWLTIADLNQNAQGLDTCTTRNWKMQNRFPWP